jgi:predicted phage gp36 major capsid-like protein
MTDCTKRVKMVVLAVALSCSFAVPALGQNDVATTTTQDLRAEVSEAMEAIAKYSEQEREDALAAAREALDRLDVEIARREEILRENWADMTDAAQDSGRAQLHNLRQARNELSERFGALQESTSSAWDELKVGFADAWDSFSDLWENSDSEPGSN